jgi:iron complex transport system ATP-binding protein
MIKLDVQNLSFAYGTTPVLKNLELKIKQNTINVFLGLNGSGKTTLLKLLTSVLSAPKNTIFIDGVDVTELSAFEKSKKVSYVPQSISDDNDFLVRDYLTFGRMNKIKFYAAPREEDFKKALAVANELKIEHLLERKMNELSGGQRQLVIIARAVVQDADVILMDEPTSSIDYQYIDRLVRYMDVLKNRGKTIVFSCHNPSIPLLLNANVFVLAEGYLKYSGEARALLTQEMLHEIYGCEIVPTDNLPYKEYSIKPIDL